MFNFNNLKDESSSLQYVINQLQEFCIKNTLPEPQYRIVQCTGSDHNPIFTYECRVSNVIRLASYGTKKGAKHLSAQKVLKALQEVNQSISYDLCSLDTVTETEVDRLDGIVRTYRDITKSELKKLPGTTIFNRYNYFNELEEERVLMARKILKEDLFPVDKVQQVFLALGLKYSISNYGQKAFWELIECDFDACLTAPFDDIYEVVVKYMKTMMNVIE